MPIIFPMEPTGKILSMVFTIINKEKIKFYKQSTQGISENARKKANIFKDIKHKIFIPLTNIQYIIYALTWPDP